MDALMNALSTLIRSRELLVYTLIGGLATLIDWGLFAVCLNQFSIHYQYALIIAYCTAGIFHYAANKLLTFQCASKQYGSQLTLFVLVMLTSLLCNIAILALLVKLVAADKVLLRMITTLAMLIPNYLLHKHITFSRRLFSYQRR
jgi:putative flippase GtrA